MAEGSTKSVAYEVTADGSQFVAAMEKTATAATSAADTIKSKFASVGKAFEEVQKTLLVLTAVVAGGTFFKEAIGASNKLTGEVMTLSKRLGITAEEAGALNTALGDIGSDSETYISAFDKFAKQIKKNEQSLNDLGLQTRDSNGNLRDSNELFTEALGKVGEYKSGLDQNTAAQLFFGKGIAEVTALQKLNNTVIEEAKRKNEELGLTVTKENVEASKKYKMAMNDVRDVLEAVEKTIGDAVMPVFTELASYFAESGPYVVDVFKGALTGLLLVFRGVAAGVKVVVAVVAETINTIIDQCGNLSELLSKVFSGDFAGAADVWKKMGDRNTQAIENVVDATKDAFHEASDSFANDISRTWDKGTAIGAPKSGTKRMGDFGKDKPEKSQAGEWEAELDEQKLAFEEMKNQQGSFQEFSKQSELDFWKAKLDLTTAGTADNVAVRKKIAETELAMNKDQYAATLESLKAQEAAYKNNSDARLDILNQESALIKERYGEDSKEYQAAQKVIVDARRQAIEQLKQLEQIRVQARRQADLSEVALEEQNSQLQRELGVITTQQELALQQQYEQRRYDISLAALQDRLALAEKDPDRSAVELARIHAELEALEQQHQLKMAAIRGAAQKDELAPLEQIYRGAQTSISNAITGILNHTMTLRQGMAAAWKGIAQSVTSAIGEMIAKKLAAWAVEKTLALAGIGANAAEAGSGAASSVANIPYVGPVLAIAALAAVFAAVSGMKSNVPSAAGGFDIPAGLNPLTQLHEQEMVLPAKHADVIRRMADSQQGPAKESQPDVHLHVHAVDGQSVRRLLLDNQDSLAVALRAAHRNGALWTKG